MIYKHLCIYRTIYIYLYYTHTPKPKYIYICPHYKNKTIPLHTHIHMLIEMCITIKYIDSNIRDTLHIGLYTSSIYMMKIS